MVIDSLQHIDQIVVSVDIVLQLGVVLMQSADIGHHFKHLFCRPARHLFEVRSLDRIEC
jgi:hypothetical protein